MECELTDFEDNGDIDGNVFEMILVTPEVSLRTELRRDDLVLIKVLCTGKLFMLFRWAKQDHF